MATQLLSNSRTSTSLRPGRLHSPRKSSQRRTNEYTEAEVSDALEGALSSGQDLVQTVRELLDETQGESGSGCRQTVFTRCVDLLNSDQLQSQTAQELVGKLLVEVESLSGSAMVTVAEQLIDCVKKGTVENGRSLELFPKLLSVISSQPHIRHQREGAGVDQMEGAEFKSHLLNSLCSCKWASSSVLHVANMCRDIPMTQDELQFLIEKILRVMESLPYSELPPLAYQLLVISTRGHKSLVLDGLQAMFNTLDRRALKDREEEEEEEGESWGRVSAVGGDQRELLLSEGTVILHITFALKQDQELGKEFLKSLKAIPTRLSSSSLSPFAVALALSVVRIHRFEDAVFDCLKSAILKSFKDRDRCTASRWIQTVSGGFPDLERCFLRTVEHSKCGWDHVVEGLVMLGFHLMDTCAPKTSNPQLSSPQYRVCSLGSRILYSCFKVHSIVHGEVIAQLINRILTNASTYVTHYITLLSEVIEMTPQVALDSLPRLREAFSYLSVLPPSSATDLLEAVLPLVQFSSSVRDSLLLVLRKSLFSRQIDVRKIAVGGYLLLLKKFTVLSFVGIDSQLSQTSTSSQSQVEVEIHGSASQSGFQALCLELLGTLKRSLSQQYEVKITLYQGLYEVLCSNSKLAEPIIELLLSQVRALCLRVIEDNSVNQLMVYYEKESDVSPPVKLEPCITTSGSEVTRTEPLDWLVHCLQMCVTQFVRREERGEGEGEGGLPDPVEEAQEVLESLVERMTDTHLDDFELDRSADFSTGSSVGQKNRIFAKLVMGLYETLMEFTFTSGDFSPESCERCLSLFHCYQRVAHILSDKSGSSSSSSAAAGGHGGSGRRGPAPSSPLSKGDHSNLSLQFIVHMLQALFVDVIPNHQQALSVLRDSLAFGRYILTSALHQIHQVQSKGVCDGVFQSRNQDKMFRLLCLLGKPLFKQLESGGGGGGGGGGSNQQGKKDKGKSIQVLCLEGFSQLLQVVDSRYPTRMAVFLSRLHPGCDETTDTAEKIHFYIEHFQGVVSGVLNGANQAWPMREVQMMVSIITCLSSHLPSSSTELEQVCKWTLAQCKEQNIDDSHVTKALVAQLLTLSNRHKEHVKMAQDDSHVTKALVAQLLTLSNRHKEHVKMAQEDNHVTKALVAQLLTLSNRHKEHVKMLRKLAQDVHYHLGDIDEDIELEFRPHFAIVNPRTASSSVLGLVYSHMEQALGDGEWLIARLKAELSTPSPNHSDEEGGSSQVVGLTQAEGHCSSLCERLMNIVVGCSELVQSAVSPGTPTEGLLKTVTKLYETLGNMAKYYVALYAFLFHIIPNFKKLVEMVGTHLSQQVYALINYIQAAQVVPTEQVDKKKGGKGKGKGSSGKTSVRREIRLIPSLIYSMEQFEKFLIQLSKKSKVNLMENFKRSMSRDFRINHQAVDAILNEEEEAEEEGERGEEGGGGGEEADSGPPMSKRLKL